MNRRQFVFGAGSVAAAWPLYLQAQPPTRAVLGILLAFPKEPGQTFVKPLRAYMEALGYAEGRNFTLDVRYADGQVERLPALAAELVAQGPTVIATFGDAAGLAAQAATSKIPVVAMSEDLVRAKLVGSMARPERNITGVSILGTELDAKRLGILAELLPPRSRVLLLADATTHRESRPALNATAQALGLILTEAVVSSPEQIDRSLRSATQQGVAGVNVLSSAFLFAHRERIITLATEARLATIFQWPENAEQGALLAYGPSLLGAFRQVATLAAKIIQGAKPGDLPVEQPTRFALFVNLGTAKSLGLAVPASILLRADKVIE